MGLTGTNNLCFEEKYEKYQNFLSEIFHFLVVKFSIYLNRRVFVMRFEYTGLTALIRTCCVRTCLRTCVCVLAALSTIFSRQDMTRSKELCAHSYCIPSAGK